MRVPVVQHVMVMVMRVMGMRVRMVVMMVRRGHVAVLFSAAQISGPKTDNHVFY